MGKRKKKRKHKQGFIPKGQQERVTYNRYSPNRQARRLGVTPEEPPKEEKPRTRAEVLSEKVQQARERQGRITPPGMTYGEYMRYLQGKRQQLEDKKNGKV